LDHELRGARPALAALADRGRDEDARHLAVRAVVGLGDLLGAADAPLAGDADLEVRVGIEIDVLHVAVLELDAQLVGGRAVHVVDAQVFDFAALFAPVDQLAFEVGLLRQLARVVGRGPLRLAAAAERRELPAFLAVPRLDRGQSLARDLRAELARTLLHLRPGGFDLSAAAAAAASGEEDLAA